MIGRSAAPAGSPRPSAAVCWHGLSVLDRAIGWLIAASSCVLLLAEIVLLLTGVVARYGFGSPLVWVDELTSAPQHFLQTGCGSGGRWLEDFLGFFFAAAACRPIGV